ncbi:F0F1 ATP synthase subunit epsilon [Pseudonocardia phyllosphaerae]|uniref:F0F1 ATP synthase subunit epsilon n=1 Tax=Pseudonocardia phyllosphaerae TaxID=3390502 RepID=UPI00397C2207
MTVELVSVERRLWSGDARFVLARTTVGEVGVLPGHQPMLAQLEEAGVIRIDGTDGSSHTIAVHGGFLSVSAERVSILAEFAEMANEIDTARARRALDGADDSEEGRAAKARAEVRLRAADAG